eukprot:TRINITY_DN79632_c0_g1_i1.p1 TRINITY_DN79632_c0_g1~~TRINITY_DN79632_c0_g1_i1.p1  ORF type:complete len:361 (-),score=59.36 TRINITY_DN79632_c0_g1_i1:74-1102(-)
MLGKAGRAAAAALPRLRGRAARSVPTIAASSYRWCSAGAERSTSLGAYLQSCGAVWGDAFEVEPVQSSDDRRTHSWQVAMPPERLAGLRRADPLESAAFPLPGGSRGRFQFFPKGDSDCSDPGSCSLWLCSDARACGEVSLRIGDVVKPKGASEFCRLEDAIKGDIIEISLQLGQEKLEETTPAVEQSLRLSGLELAEWQLFGASSLKAAQEGNLGQLVSSPPFRFHHVLLGDFYLELLPGFPYPEHCVILFRSRVPTMQLQISLSVGSAFSKTILALGKSTVEDDLKAASYLQVNLGAPGVLAEDGSITVSCKLEEVVSIPAQLRGMIPKLNERTKWPKRI